MVEIKATIKIYGKNFSPIKLRQEISMDFSKSIEKGEIGSYGRYKGSVIPYGSAIISPPDSVGQINSIVWLIKYIADKIDLIRKHGAQDITLDVAYYYGGQCNCALSIEELEGLAKLKIPFVFSVYKL